MRSLGRTVVLYLTLGILINIAIAWLVVLPLRQYAWRVGIRLSFTRVDGQSSNDIPRWNFSIHDRLGHTNYYGQPFDTPPMFVGFPTTGDIPRWSRMNLPPPSPRRDRVDWRFHEDAYGWPMRTLYASFINEPRHDSDSHLNIVHGLSLWRRENASALGREFVTLPTRPIWSGFMVNTLIFATSLCLLTNGIGRTRRRWRVAHGRCRVCGYDLRDDVDAGCPECGWNRSGVQSV